MKVEEKIFKGTSVVPGIGVGKAVVLIITDADLYRMQIPDFRVENEIERLRKAVDIASARVEKMRNKVSKQLGTELAGIFEAHIQLLKDRNFFIKRVEKKIKQNYLNAEGAVWEVVEELIKDLKGLADRTFYERTRQDLNNVAIYLVEALQGVSHHEINEVGEDVVVVADDIAPSLAIHLGRKGVKGFALEHGGVTSHTSIIAKSLNIPMVIGVHGITKSVRPNDHVVVDGRRGEVIVRPTQEHKEEYLTIVKIHKRREVEYLDELVSLPAVTLDGIEVALLANIDLAEEINLAKKVNAQGVGLYRSEFIFIEKHPYTPTENDHYNVYSKLLKEFSPNRVIIRTHDLGGKKVAQDVIETHEDNPVLGLRGIRLFLAHKDILETQLRALLKAGCETDNLWIMLPLVSSVDEIIIFKEILRDTVKDVEEQTGKQCKFKLGTMIEVPSAALTAKHIAEEVDFFSIGTNDLTQYTLAVDRNNEHVAYLFDSLHPSVLKLIKETFIAAQEKGIETSVCGEMSCDPKGVVYLLSLGIRTLSMNPRNILHVKRVIRNLNIGEIKDDIMKVLQLSNAKEVSSFISNVVKDKIGLKL